MCLDERACRFVLGVDPVLLRARRGLGEQPLGLGHGHLEHRRLLLLELGPERFFARPALGGRLLLVATGLALGLGGGGGDRAVANLACVVGGLFAELTRPGLGVGDGREVRLFGVGQQPLGLGLPALGLGVRVGQHLVADAAGVADDRVARLFGLGDEAARLGLDLRQRVVPQALRDDARVTHDAGGVGQQPVAVGQRVVAAAGFFPAVHAHLVVLGVGSFPLDCVVIGWRDHT